MIWQKTTFRDLQTKLKHTENTSEQDSWSVNLVNVCVGYTKVRRRLKNLSVQKLLTGSVGMNSKVHFTFFNHTAISVFLHNANPAKSCCNFEIFQIFMRKRGRIYTGKISDIDIVWTFITAVSLLSVYPLDGGKSGSSWGEITLENDMEASELPSVSRRVLDALHAVYATEKSLCRRITDKRLDSSGAIWQQRGSNRMLMLLQ